MGSLVSQRDESTKARGRAWRAIVAATLLITLAGVSGCGGIVPPAERTNYWERADEMHLLNRPNTTGESPDMETTDNNWWFY